MTTPGDFGVCDSQVHAPDLPSAVHVGGLDAPVLLKEMREAGVDRCVVVPLAAAGGDVSANNGPAVAMMRAHPGRFAVMGRFEITRPDDAHRLETWVADGMLGVRLSFVRGVEHELFVERRLEWFWSAAERADLPLMLLVPNDLVHRIGEIAVRHPRLRLVVDHLGLTPYEIYTDVGTAVEPLLKLAAHPNVAVKATALPASVPDAFPFRSLHEPLERVFDAFGPQRLFWGSDLTRLECPYSECVRLFSEELPFLSSEDRSWVMGRGVMEWLRWTPTPLP